MMYRSTCFADSFHPCNHNFVADNGGSFGAITTLRVNCTRTLAETEDKLVNDVERALEPRNRELGRRDKKVPCPLIASLGSKSVAATYWSFEPDSSQNQLSITVRPVNPSFPPQPFFDLC
ncbi:hypothetical protein JYU34_014086 [Plutella xylostella]|uniref:Uncharacterized protein n=1 Tax=Plutella xylostella TaxID=51655 RepID=A0ABQ7Q8I7_PLUXY|nr:hypothetical protein JYU34_014086 [Plutella xylostella]